MRRRADISVYLILGFACLCVIITLCSFPGSLMGDVDHTLYRSFNIAFVSSYVIASVVFAAVGLLGSKRLVVIVSESSFLVLAIGLYLSDQVMSGLSLSLAAFVGMLCGVGLSITTAFWLVLLMFLSERTAMRSLGWQMLAGTLAFIFVVSVFGRFPHILSAGICILSCLLSLPLLKMDILRSSERFPRLSLWEAVGDLMRRGIVSSKMGLPLLGFTLVSFIYGIVEVVAMGVAGSPNGATASYWGGPVGASAFLVWLYLSHDRNYDGALRVMFVLFAVAFMVPVFDVTVFMMSAGYTASWLLLISLIIDEFSSNKHVGTALIAISLAVSKGMLLIGLYVPGLFGVRSHLAYYQSAYLPMFIVYLVFILIFVFSRSLRPGVKMASLQAIVSGVKDRFGEKEDLPALETDTIDRACQTIAYEHHLTKRETEILDYLAHGRDTAFICEKLSLSRNTIKGYTKTLYMKTEVHSRQELIDKVEEAKP